jgi:hypothetical protein
MNFKEINPTQECKGHFVSAAGVEGVDSMRKRAHNPDKSTCAFLKLRPMNGFDILWSFIHLIRLILSTILFVMIESIPIYRYIKTSPFKVVLLDYS